MKYCTQCGTTLAEGVAFCSSCGQRVQVQPAAAVVSTAGPTIADKTQEVISSAPNLQPALEFCVKCGARIAPESAFCSSCGTPRMQVAQPLRPATGTDNKAQNAMIIEIVAGIFGFLGIGHMYSGRTGLGVALLVGWWIGLGILVTIAATGVGACLSIPVMLAVPIYSGIQARDFVRSQS